MKKIHTQDLCRAQTWDAQKMRRKGVRMDVNLRAVVLDILLEVSENGSYSHLVIRQALNKYQYLDKQQRAFMTRLAEGTIERQLELDYLIDYISKTKTAKMKPVIRNILRMSAYQMKYMNHVPISAVCNEAVKLAVKRGFSSLRGFVNGVLRNLSRQRDTIAYPAAEENPALYLSVKYSMPMWIVEHFQTMYEDAVVEQILAGFAKDKKTYIRCNRTLTTPETVKKQLEQEGVTVECVPQCDYAFCIHGYDYLSDLPSFAQGLFQVQDLSSIIAGLVVQPKAGDLIIDVCAAPGGKCIHAAERLAVAEQSGAACGRVQARDISEHKVELILSNIARMRTNNITAKVWDAAVRDESLVGQVDILLADVPCSGLGILGRKADVRYKADKENLQKLVELQRSILSTVSEYVKEGGELIYSTCTINEAENFGNVQWFTEHFPFEIISVEQDLPFFDKTRIIKGCVQLLPGIDQTDGFFVAKLRRTHQ